VINLLDLYSRLPNWKGKLFLANKFITPHPHDMPRRQKMINGFLMDLQLQDRIQRLMYIKRLYENETVLALTAELKTARTMIDIGANIGYFSLLTKALNRNCHVISIEPLPRNVEQLKHQKEINHFDKMDIIDVCLSDEVGTTSFAVPPMEECGWGRIAYRDFFDGQIVEKPMTTLDHLCRERQIKSIDLIKMDVEGFEFKVLKGMENTLKEHKPVLCIELNEPCLLDLGTSGQEIIDWLHTKEYTMYILDRNGQKHPTLTLKENYEFLNYIAIPNT
jgi:FkbM family methyltransferase